MLDFIFAKLGIDRRKGLYGASKHWSHTTKFGIQLAVVSLLLGVVGDYFGGYGWKYGATEEKQDLILGEQYASNSKLDMLIARNQNLQAKMDALAVVSDHHLAEARDIFGENYTMFGVIGSDAYETYSSPGIKVNWSTSHIIKQNEFFIKMNLPDIMFNMPQEFTTNFNMIGVRADIDKRAKGLQPLMTIGKSVVAAKILNGNDPIVIAIGVVPSSAR